MAFALKDYQSRALESLGVFLAHARGAHDAGGMQSAFAAGRKHAFGEAAPKAPYRAFSQGAPATPVACIRIPTGGGKTLMAAHAIEIAGRLYVGRAAAPLAVWLVPTDAIRTQTLDALRTAGHPYREALTQHWPDDRLIVLDISEAEQLRAEDFGRRAVILVGTIQTLRVEKTQGREAYAYKEAFEPHFANLPSREPFFELVSEDDLKAQPYLGTGDLGRVKRSLVNLLAWHRPIVIVDEAHNARSGLSFETLRRIRPACVIEWTATPAPDQNVLYHVSADVLKAEDMIKLPIVLAPHPNWREAVRDAVLTREKLQIEAGSESDYVRPIVLFQADAKDGEVPVDALRSFLVDELHIEPRRIAVATGAQRELDGIDLLDKQCLIEFVVTVEALKEGWDCSFAYVFCTVQNVRSAKDMEQLLGRVLRMPYAKRRTSERLNRAYAHVCAPVTAQVASQLADRLISMGFEQMEAVRYIETEPGGLFDPDSESPAPSRTIESAFEVPAEQAVAVAAAIGGQASVASSSEAGMSVLSVSGALTPEAIDAAVAAVPRAARAAVAAALSRHQTRVHVAAAPSERGVAFAPVPQLAIPVQGELQLFEPEILASLADYSLAGQTADVPTFKREESLRPFLVDVERGRTKIREDDDQHPLDLDQGSSEAVRREDLIRALDRRLQRRDVLQPDLIAWLGRMLDGLLERGFELNYLARHINALAEAAGENIARLLRAENDRVFQQSLVDGPQKVRIDPSSRFRYDPQRYPARWHYTGRYEFRKHFYPAPGELDPDLHSEETSCAIAIDRLPEVKHWVRNLERQPETSFWLPTSTDRFYPDFVAELLDGRLLVVEYKGAHLYGNADSREKRDIGLVWARESGNVFVMATDQSTAGVDVAAQLKKSIDEGSK